jgi:hemerythrin-like domain-containing protein
MYPLLDRLNRDHRNLAQVLNLLTKLLDRFHEGQEPDLELICEMLDYIESYADQIHHPSEDLVFERLIEQAGESPMVLGILMNQHRQLPQLNRRFRSSLDGIVHGDVLLREEVEAQGRELVQTLWSHMKTEDQEAFPLAKQRLSAEDWADLDRISPKVDDPLFDIPDPARYQALFAALATQAEP